VHHIRKKPLKKRQKAKLSEGDPIMSEEPIPETAATTDAASKLNEGKTHATQAVNDLRAAAEAKAAELRATAEAKAAEIRGKAEHVYGEARTRAQSLRGESEHWIRENPTRAVLTAMGVGFIVGLMFRK
jgi:ElaB/YqjD/DUF883 family membrane-anchored ribosome-binding protein